MKKFIIVKPDPTYPDYFCGFLSSRCLEISGSKKQAKVFESFESAETEKTKHGLLKDFEIVEIKEGT